MHYQSHVDNRYKKGLLRTMLDRTHRLSSSWTHFYYQNIKENSLPSQQDRVLPMCASHVIRNLVKMADVAGETYP